MRGLSTIWKLYVLWITLLACFALFSDGSWLRLNGYLLLIPALVPGVLLLLFVPIRRGQR